MGTRTKMILVAIRIENSKNEDMTPTTKTPELSNEILLDFRLRCLELPVYEKQLISGLRSETEVGELILQGLRVNCIRPQSFIRIGWRVWEELRDDTWNKRHLKKGDYRKKVIYHNIFTISSIY